MCACKFPDQRISRPNFTLHRYSWTTAEAVNYDPDLTRRSVDPYATNSAGQHEREGTCLQGPYSPQKVAKGSKRASMDLEKNVGELSRAGDGSAASSSELTKTGQKSTNSSSKWAQFVYHSIPTAESCHTALL
jgi:hypothetical protein